MTSSIHPVLGTPIYSQEHLNKLKHKAIVVSKPENELETGVYRSSISPQELVKDFPKIKTYYEMFNNSVKNYGNLNCLGYRVPLRQDPKSGVTTWSDYQWKTYNEVNQDRVDFGAGLMNVYDLYISKKTPTWFLGIYSVNRYEWVVSDLGAGCYSVPNVSLYDTLGPETSEFIINHSELPIIVTSVDKVANLLSLSSKCPDLKVIIVMENLLKQPESPIPILQKWGAQLGVTILTFSQILQLGKKNPRPHQPPQPDDVCLISYTSGTTGNPKGAMLSHTNIISTLRAGSLVLPLDSSDIHISYLPLAHIFERVLLSNTLFIGGSAGFFRGDVALLIEDLGVLRPTIFASVPRLFNRIYDKIVQGALNSGSAVKAALFTKALDSKLYHLKHGGHLTHSVWDPLVFSKVKAVLGGRVRLMISGSAPISSTVMNFLRVATGAQMIEGYGQTESCAGLTLSWKDDFLPGHVGSVQANMELKLVSVPEMNYHAKDLKGEVWVRGHGVFLGYLKDQKKTDETITADKWLQTGDIGTLDKYGRLSIVDRKKNIFKLAQGEYIAPEKLEGSYLKSNFVAQIYVHGDSLQSELVAIVVPDQEYCLKWAVEKGVLPSSTILPPPPPPSTPLDPLVKTICSSPVFKAAVLADLEKMGKSDKLRGFEFIKAVHLHHDLFTAESGLLTPTFKLKRNEAGALFRPQIDEMYKELLAKKPPAKL